MEFVNNVHSKVIAEAEIKLPIAMDKKEYLNSKFVKPAIRLLAQTPVRGKGIATKPVKERYFTKLFDFWSICELLEE